ncbi:MULTISPECIES: hypothetical protein [unclassified Colwellia]|uniref:hypothetical protein n=1 Tax=unclassified Colwellia TaxID=196834 RepID=UPI0015F6E2AD|nr:MULTISPECIES: hypothetical protein [unclassified Colwellia]MBA6250792.1 hypothetical protein [Colwellia sp. MB3u-55]MBA6399800.1 hypothetical protein [Colwellia sp. BRX10-4]
MNKEIMRKLIVWMFILFLSQGCTKQQLGGVATVTALLVSVPLIPFAEAYHVINDTDGKAKEQREIWEAQFDPVYIARTDLINIRNPEFDAESLYRKGHVAFFPSVPSNGIYPGLKYEMENSNYKENQLTISNNVDLNSLQVLMAKDPLHKETAGWKYNNDVFRTFWDTGLKYKVNFNQRMSELSELHSPNKKINKD